MYKVLKSKVDIWIYVFRALRVKITLFFVVMEIGIKTRRGSTSNKFGKALFRSFCCYREKRLDGNFVKLIITVFPSLVSESKVSAIHMTGL